MKFFSVLLITLLFISSASAISLPEGYVVPKETLSPDGNYGVLVPIFNIVDDREAHNSLVEMKAGKVITKINASPGFDRRLNHNERVPPWWSKNESLVLWKVDGKWCPDALVLIQLKNGAQAWQLNVLTAFQQKILDYTKKAASSEKYEAAKKSNAGCGSAYPEGFTIDVEPVIPSTNLPSSSSERSPLTLPLKIHVTLTTNPKQIPDAPNLNAEMDGVVKEGGIIEVREFKLLP